MIKVSKNKVFYALFALILLAGSSVAFAQDVPVFDEPVDEEVFPVLDQVPVKVQALMATSSIALDTAYTLISEKDSTREITARLDILISLNREILKALK